MAPHLATRTDAKRQATVVRELEAATATVRELTQRMKTIEQAVHRITSSRTLTEDQRVELLGLLAGTRRGQLDPTHVHNSPPEQRLVDNFRIMSSNRRRIVSLLFAELAREEQEHAVRMRRRQPRRTT
jgi:hypothetical protein